MSYGPIGAQRFRSVAEEHALVQKQRSKSSDPRKCIGCNMPQRGPFNKRRARECKAYGRTCDKCGRQNHFTNLCKSKTVASIEPLANTETEENQQEVSVNGFITGILASMVISTPDSALPVIANLRSRTKS